MLDNEASNTFKDFLIQESIDYKFHQKNIE